MSVDENKRTRREFLRGLVESGVVCRLAPVFVAASQLAVPTQAEAGLFDSRRARETMAAFADTVIPPDDRSPGGAECGFVEVLYDKSFYEVFVGFEVPIAPVMRLLVVDLDRRSLWFCRKRFRNADPKDREYVLKRALEGNFRIAYEGMIALVKAIVFGGQKSTLGWEILGYPGPADAHPGACPAAPPPTHQMTEDGNPP